MFSIDAKVAVITGAASGIGLATARRFAAAGAWVTLADVNEASHIGAQIGGDFVRTDVSREEEVEALMRRAAKPLGHLDARPVRARAALLGQPGNLLRRQWTGLQKLLIALRLCIKFRRHYCTSLLSRPSA